MKTRVKPQVENNTPKKGVKKTPMKAKPAAATKVATKATTPAKKRAVLETPAKVVNKSVTKITPKKQPEVKKVEVKKPAAKGKSPKKKVVVTQVDEDDDEEEEEVVNEQQVEEEEEEEEQDDEMEAEADQEQENVEEEEEEEEENVEEEEKEEEENVEEAEEQEEEEEEEVNQNEEEEEEEEVDENEEQEEEEEDEAPEEAPAKTETSLNKSSTGEPKHPFSTDKPAATVPEENLIYIQNVPEKAKVLMLFHVLKNCGIILNIHKNTTEAGNETIIAYETKDSAVNALLFLQKFTLKSVGELTLVSKTLTEKNLNDLSEKTVVIRNVNPSLTIEDLKKEFSDGGTILYASFIPPQYVGYSTKYTPLKGVGYGKSAAITYKTKDGAECALEKHNSVLGERHIWVSMKNKMPNNFPECTIKLANTNNYTTFSQDTLKKIFEDCGEIHYIEIICSQAILATITFLNNESVQKALALNNTTVEKLLINASIHNSPQGTTVATEKTTIYIYGFKPGTPEEEIRTLFEREVGADSIKSVKIFSKSGYITFDTVDNYCKSFKLDESKINGQPIFIEPDSIDKVQRTLRRQQSLPKHMDNRKRSFNMPVDFQNNPVQNVAYGPPNNKRPRPNFTPGGGPQGFTPRNMMQRNQNGFQPRNNFQGNQNGFQPRNNFKGNTNRFPPRNQQANGNNFQQGGAPNGNFFQKQFRQPAANGQQQQNTFNRNPNGPKKFNKNKPGTGPGGGPKMFKKQNNNFVPGSA